MRLPIWTASLLVALAVPAPGRAQGGESVLTPPQVFALAEEYRHQGRIADAESLLQALARDANPDYRAEARFRLGELRMARKDYAGAADAFSALLEEKPNAQPARLELARALALLGKSGAAERQLRRAQAGGLPEDIQRLVDRFGDVLRRSRPYGASIQIGLAPDSNINQATDARTLDIGGFPLTLDQSGRAT
jgi:tetratricopeptide (TPR) repeat protein